MPANLLSIFLHEVMKCMRTDFSCTVFLNDGYEGGELLLETAEGHVLKSPPGQPGMCIVYDCGRAHRVTPVTKGERISAIFWIKSLFRDRSQRILMRDFKNILDKWEREDAKPEARGELFTSLTGVQTELCRMWVEA